MFGLDRIPLILGAAIIALLLAGGCFWGGMAAIDRMEERAAATARDARDAHWEAEIAKSSAAAERERADQRDRRAEAETTAAAEIGRLNTTLAELEKRNADLPDADRCGLSRERGRLLGEGR